MAYGQPRHSNASSVSTLQFQRSPEETRSSTHFTDHRMEASSISDAVAQRLSGDMAALHHDQLRKDSITNESSHVSMSDSDIKWNPKYEYTGLGFDNNSGAFAATNPFYPSEGLYPRQDHTDHLSASAPSHGSWFLEHTAPSDQPGHFASFSPCEDDLSMPAYTHTHMDHLHSAHASVTHSLDEPEAAFIAPSQVKTPLSSNSNNDWGSIPSIPPPPPPPPEPHTSGRTLLKRERPHPAMRSMSDCARPEGIRKKNTRIEIPHEVNLFTIDGLIENCDDEKEAKELKSQRRLLRNRDAALASRQRKKKHTEDLEVKEKDHLVRIHELEAQMEEMSIQFAHVEHEAQFLRQKSAHLTNTIDALHIQQEEIVVSHTQETGNLRRKIKYLTDQIESTAAAPMSAAPSSTGINEFTTNMDALSVNPHDWSTLQDHRQQQQQQQDLVYQQDHLHYQDHSVHGQMQSQHANAATSSHVNQGPDQPVATGILFMILLCGAFVASRSSSRGHVPQMPEEVRAASSTVLKSLLREGGADSLSLTQQLHGMSTHTSNEPQSSHVMSSWDVSPRSPDGRLNTLHRALTTPTSSQDAEQFYSITPAEYQSMTNTEPFPMHDNPTGPSLSRRKTLAEALTHSRLESINKGGAAEVYTRSLLWEQIPSDVVKQFKDLVKDGQVEQEVTQHNRVNNIYG